MTCTIRNANFNDLEAIYDLVVELAIFEKEEDSL